jgi:trans-2,3-dihydro-3-hydroxyanthranilate isomerase
MGLRFYIVDVFSSCKYAGNQLAVVRNASELSSHEMQQIAQEMNYSETTFILSDQEINGGYDVRIFTPKREVPFAGHPSLGTAFVIQKEIIKKPVDTVFLNLKIGQIPVTLSYKEEKPDILWMRQKRPDFGRIYSPEEITSVLGLQIRDIDKRFPVQEVSTGIPFIIVSLKTLAALKKTRIEKDKYFELIKDTDAKAILVFCPETYHKGNHLSVRVFADYYGVPEDPATGSANGCLAGYLVEYKYFNKNYVDIRVEQGYEIDRPSLLYLKAEKVDDEILVFVGGNAVMVAVGELV